MFRSITLIIAILVLSGCSELQVIGRAAVKDQAPGAINTEWAMYTQRNMVPPSQMKRRTMLANAEVNVNAMKMAAQKASQKGLWERH